MLPLLLLEMSQWPRRLLWLVKDHGFQSGNLGFCDGKAGAESVV